MPWWGWVSIGVTAWVIASIVCTPLMGKTIALRDRPDEARYDSLTTPEEG